LRSGFEKRRWDAGTVIGTETGRRRAKWPNSPPEKESGITLELFREAYGLSGHVVYADKPDVIVQDAEKQLGLRNKFISQRR
jgi:hypothetical protein